MKMHFSISRILLNKILLVLIFIILLFSCGIRQKVVYFNAFESSNVSETETRIKKDDLLQILIYNGDELNSKIYNLPESQNVNGGYLIGTPVKSAYLVDKNGDIELPNLGKFHVLNLTKNELIELIKFKVSEFLNKPIVFVRIQNFRITVLGDVKNPGTIQVPNEKISLIEAIGLAGDLNISARRNSLVVLREIDGKIQKIKINLNDQSVFTSQVYYLQQNDIVYVEPNQSKINSSLISSASGVFISVASLIITTINVITK